MSKSRFTSLRRAGQTGAKRPGFAGIPGRRVRSKPGRIGFFVRGLTVALTALIATVCSAQHSAVTIDGEAVKFADAQPQSIDGTIFVPLRGVFEQMGADVKWDEDQHRVEVTKGKHNIQMRVEGKSAMVDNRAVNLDARARLVHGSLMIPLRFVTSALGCEVKWDAPSHTVQIKSDNGHFISNSLKPAINSAGGG